MKTQTEWIAAGYIPIAKKPDGAKIIHLTASRECLETRGENPSQCVRDCTKCEWCMVKVLEVKQ